MAAAAFMVSYPAMAGARFDRDYYIATHMPLVHEKLGPHGLTDAVALFPEGDAPGHVAIAVLTFRDADARTAALSSPDAVPVMTDVANFTDIQPTPQMLTVG